ncbi:NAD-dependent epimerase/dehydratase family protein [Gloeocapsa sp. PCC 73106]|uniref:NAD-dependent epimerase/dehydratase family protein n=1 Tax=Gloeocapsa sp. PCC 73106 TaxID=102232 RepID=UPI0002ACEB45|nr:NAD-dependent epimerase/dehydratase family protein [Gloeocapsa sp. PCC 73106]ELR99986.1 nucleoside-diphosphate-sugar epimerase [Gloeocapsa sp. PCC 73106]
MAIHLVTGVGGFIGSHLAEALLNQGEQVIGVDHFNDYYDPTIKRQNATVLQQFSSFKLIEADIEHLDWQNLLSGVEYLYHQAAQAGVRASWGESFHHYTSRNINATQIILEAAKESKSLKRFVFASTSSVYGNAETFPTPETICPQPVSPYGITKLAAERLCWLYQQNFGVPVTALRYFTVYGPRQRPDMAFHKFFKAAIAQSSIDIYGDGQQTRDFTFISDIVAANLAAAQVEGAIGEVFNIGGGSRVVLEDILKQIETISDRPLLRNYIGRAKGDARHTSADITKAQQILNYQPRVSLSKGLTQEWEWIKKLLE